MGFIRLYVGIQVIAAVISNVNSESIQITSGNYDGYKASKEVLLLNFYADWCRFSQMLKPIFDKAADILHGETEKVLLGKVNCEQEKGLCANPFHITKYPTLKLVRDGQIVQREYRGQRTSEAIASYIRDQIRDPVEAIHDLQQLASKQFKKAVVGYFSDNGSAGYHNFVNIARSLRDECSFYAYFGEAREMGQQVVYREEKMSDVMYTGSVEDQPALQSWVTEHCLPLVREITFQNGEEMTEMGLPLLILFYHPEDTSVKELFKQRVEVELKEHRGTVNCVTADGIMFAHPLHHLGKHKNDLPVLAIDSFRHMYVFPNFEDIRVDGKIHQFISDLHSGKLHRDFHNPPPPTQQQPQTPEQQKQQQQQHVEKRDVPQDPPESTFKKLAPARDRYSFRDEL